MVHWINYMILLMEIFTSDQKKETKNEKTKNLYDKTQKKKSKTYSTHTHTYWIDNEDIWNFNEKIKTKRNQGIQNPKKKSKRKKFYFNQMYFVFAFFLLTFNPSLLHLCLWTTFLFFSFSLYISSKNIKFWLRRLYKSEKRKWNCFQLRLNEHPKNNLNY